MFRSVIKLQLHLVVALILLTYEPSAKLASGQLEAVGAVLSVVPVTSILATAGLVGVKLAALSRLLDILGYDRAYLAQNLGTGTAAAPIGLKTRYAYMFPYVPGLNISVRGDDSIGMPNDPGVELTDDGAKTTPVVPVDGTGAGKRKTYPAMGLPGNYENQRRPFRGSDALKDIFKKAGLQVHLPTPMQQQQLQQQFNLPAQAGKQAIIIELPRSAASVDKQQQSIATGSGLASRHSSTASLSSFLHPILDTARGLQAASPVAGAQGRPESQQQARPQTFGMPASNINNLRRRRRRRRHAGAQAWKLLDTRLAGPL